MFFRRATKPSQQRPTPKNTMAAATIKPIHTHSGNTPANRSEPALINPDAVSQSTQGSSPMTASAPPISPLAMAQARRNPNAPAPAFSRGEQQRKLIVGRDISLNGEIATCDHLVVEGIVTATVKDGQLLEILEKGSFTGAVEIIQADIAGHFDGDLIVHGKLTIRSTAKITGSITYNSLQVDHGAVINGKMSTLPQQSAMAPATQNNTQTPVNNGFVSTNIQMSTQGTYLSSELDQSGFLKASGQ